MPAAVIAYPDTTSNSAFNPMGFDFGLRTNVFITTSSHNGGMQTIEMPGGHRWVASLTYDIQSTANRAALEAFWTSIKGQSNRVSLCHLARPVPRGTINTTGLTVSAGVAAGVRTLVIAGAGGTNTMKAGDMARITLADASTQLVMCVADATASGGLLTMNFEPQLRWSASTAASVVVNRPTATFILTSSEVRVPYEGYIATGFSVDLVELF